MKCSKGSDNDTKIKKKSSRSSLKSTSKTAKSRLMKTKLNTNEIINNDDKEQSKNEEQEESGKAQRVITQVLHISDDSETEIAVWGGYYLDGYDRTLNIFIEFSELINFINHHIDMNDNDEITDPCDCEIGYQTTVYFTDKPVTTIMKVGEGKISMVTYERNGNRTISDVIDLFSCEIEDEIDIKQLGNECKRLFVGIYTIRNYLKEKGIVQELYDKFDESYGVQISVSKTGRITTEIVNGDSRPDLPCSTLFDTQMLRPYIDEVLGLKATGTRSSAMLRNCKDESEKPQTKNKTVNTRKESKTKKKSNTIQKRKKVETQSEILAREMALWEKTVEELKTKRDKEEEIKKEQINEEASTLLASLTQSRDLSLLECEKEINELKKIMDSQMEELSNLSFFQIIRKRELKKNYSINELSLMDLEKKKSKIWDDFNWQNKKNKEETQAKLNDLVDEMNRLYPIPDSPIEKEQQRQEAQKKAEIEKRRNDVLSDLYEKKDEILMRIRQRYINDIEKQQLFEIAFSILLYKYELPCYINDIRNGAIELEECSSHRIIYLLKILEEYGLKAKTENGVINYYFDVI